MPPPPGSNESFGETEAAAVLTAETLLSQDNIPDENQKLNCHACDVELTGLFCHACGQKNDDYRRSILSLVKETMASIFSLENRMWRTWAKLFTKPGQVAREYADGKRTSWTSPVRIYLALSIILFGYIGLTETRIFSIRTDIVPKSGFTGPVEALPDQSVSLKPDFGFFRRQAGIDRLNKGTDFERVAKLLKGTPTDVFVFNGDLSALGITPTDELLKSSDSWPESVVNDEKSSLTPLELRERAIENYTDKIADAVNDYNQVLLLSGNKALEALSETDFSETDEVQQAIQDAFLPLDKNLEKLGITREIITTLPTELRSDFAFDLGQGQVNGVRFSQTDMQDLANQVLRNPAMLNDGLSKYLPRIMFLMMPFAAIIGLIFIRGKTTALLYDHLVHATYIHAVTFAFLLILILLSQWTPMTGLMQIFLIGLTIYLPISAKNMFKRGWVKTIFASFSIASLYGLAMFFVVTILTAGSMVRALEASQI